MSKQQAAIFDKNTENGCIPKFTDAEYRRILQYFKKRELFQGKNLPPPRLAGETFPEFKFFSPLTFSRHEAENFTTD